MSGKVFINYRRGDDPGFTQALYQRLEDVLGADRLFMDVEGHIRPGDDFVHVLDRQVAASDVVLAVIGPRWVELMAARLAAADDFVAIELKSAIDRGKRVIPVLVGGAEMPRTDQLPAPIQALARRNAVGLRPERFKADCQGLLTALEQQLLDAEAERQAKSEAERRAAEDARRRREADEAERARAAEERARARAAQGLSPEEIRKAEELASWDYVRARGDEADVRDHLARFPGGVTERNAMAKLDGLVWNGLGTDPGLASLHQYVAAFPKGDHLDEAKARIARLEKAEADGKALADRKAAETAAWGAVAASKVPEELEAFLKQWPDGEYADAARARLRELAFGTLGKRIAKVPPALTMAVVALALWLLLAFAGFVLTETIDRIEVALLLLTPLSAAIVAVALYLFTPRTRWQISSAVGGSSLLVAVWSALSPSLLLYGGLTAATMAGPVIVEPRARDWKVMTACVAAAFGIGLASNDSYGFGLYLVGLPIAVMWAAALGHVFAKQAMAGAPTESVNSPRVPHPADSTIANAANGNADRRATAVRWAKRLFYWLTAVGAAGLCGGLLTDFARSELSWGSGPESAALGIAGGLFVFALFVRYARRRQRQSHSSTPPAPKTAA